ncbi:MAG: GAF domain-containing protein [Deltaproteobacteria bacterium]|nr:MAG: GAF domain-containing protein [Deltaproteobacteria bacterium]
MQFEVQIPKRSNPEQLETFVIEGPNWLVALQDSLNQLGESMETRNIVCDILDENVVQVTEPTSGRTFSVKPAEERSSNDTRAEDLPAAMNLIEEQAPAPSAPAGATEAFLPPIDFFQQQTEGPSLSQEDPGATMQTREALGEEAAGGQPVNVEVSEVLQPTTISDADDDVPFAVANVPSEEQLPEEDLDFAAPIAIVAGSSSSAPVEQPAIVDPEPPAPVAPPAPTPAPVAAEPPVPAEPLPPIEPPAPAPEPAPAAPEPAAPMLSISSVSGSSGKYTPGMTTEILADAFMRAMEIYDYGEDRHAAMQFVLDLALNNVNAGGGAVLLTDINSPNQELWFEVASGPKSDEMLNFRIPMGQGIIGYCAHEGVSQLIADPMQEPRFQEDVLNLVNLAPSSILAVPIQHQKRMLGAIVLYNQQGERPFTQGELSIVNYLAHTAGEYLINLV